MADLGSPEIILVAGLGRCGTSLALQMLSAGGVDCIGTRPAFEDAPHHNSLRTDPRQWAEQASGKAVKALDPHRFTPPLGPSYRAFWLFRDYPDQARSQLKMAGGSYDRGSRKRMERSLKVETDLAGAALRRAGAIDIQVLPFDCLLLRPREMAIIMARHLRRHLDIDQMVGVVVERSPRCFPGFLETMLVAA